MADGDIVADAKRVKKELLGSLKSKDALIKALKVCHIAPERHYPAPPPWPWHPSTGHRTEEETYSSLRCLSVAAFGQPFYVQKWMSVIKHCCLR